VKLTRRARFCEIGALLAAFIFARPALAQPRDPPKAEDPATAEARVHFQNGVKLFNSRDWRGALSEFDAAYKLKPGPSSLKNIALCQKELFRYREAYDTLKKTLERHGKELSNDDRKAIEDAMTELASLVGSVVIRVTPSQAKVFLDGRLLEAEDLTRSIRLDTGEHTVVAEAPGYGKISRTIRISGGQKDVPVDFALQPSGGFAVIRSKDPKAAIAIDGKAMAFATWTGPLPPGRHYVQVYRDGFKPFDQAFVIELGKTVEIEADLRPDDAPKAPPVTQKGWYALVALSGIGLRNSPEGLETNESDISGSSAGVRAGYRVWTPVAVELLLEGGRHKVKKACEQGVEPSGGGGCFPRSFTLDSIRVGPNLRILSAGESLRFTSTAGAGAVRHEMNLDKASDKAASGAPMPAGNAKGWDPYFLVEVGIQYNWGHALLELDAVAFIDGASNVKGTQTGGKSWEPYRDTGGLLMAGIGLRGGWSEWAPR
jgi:hypothetical protein